MAEDEKHCGKLTDHDAHPWPGIRDWPGDPRPQRWCKGWIALDGATRPQGNTKQFEKEKKRG